MSLALARHDAIDTRKASLPANYEKAKTAIAACERIDECKDWADKAKALASYAKQANDDELVRMATRIQLRAVRRCGELLKALAPKETPGRPTNYTGSGTITRAQAASEAGLSKRQKDTALRVASIPEDEFELAVEEEAPTVTSMAGRGTRKKPMVDLLEGRDPADFKAATAVQGWLLPLAEVVQKFPPEQIVRGSRPREMPIMLRHLATLLPWLKKLETALIKESEC